MRHVVASILVCCALSACSSTRLPNSPPQLVVADNDVECKRDVPMGTIRTRTKCTTAAQREEERKEAERAAQQGEDQLTRRQMQEAMRRSMEENIRRQAEHAASQVPEF